MRVGHRRVDEHVAALGHELVHAVTLDEHGHGPGVRLGHVRRHLDLAVEQLLVLKGAGVHLPHAAQRHGGAAAGPDGTGAGDVVLIGDDCGDVDTECLRQSLHGPHARL